MSELKVTTVKSPDPNTDLILASGNSQSGQILISANGAGVTLKANSTVNAITINTTSWTFSNNPVFSTNTFTVGTAAYFVANGNVGIGNNTPASKLSIAGGIDAGTIRSTFQAIPSSGQGIELLWSSNVGYLIPYDRSSNTFLPLVTQSSSFAVQTGNTSATTRFSISSNGNVGFGNSSPAHKLSINGSTFISQVGLFSYLDSVPTLSTEASFLGSDQSFRIKTTGGNVSHFLVEAGTGKVGIGTPSPKNKLTVLGNTYIGTSSFDIAPASVNTFAQFVVGYSTVIGSHLTYTPGSTTGGFYVDSYDLNNGANYDLVVNLSAMPHSWTGNGNGSLFRFLTSANSTSSPSERMRINKDGNVGIATTNLLNKLNVMANTNNILVTGATSGGGNLPGIDFITNPDTPSTWRSAQIYAYDQPNVGYGAGLIFKTNSGNSSSYGTEAMRIDGFGNIGVGTGASNSRLHVSGGQVRINNGSDLYLNSAAGESYLYTSSTPMAFWTNGTKQMNIDTSGRVTKGNQPMFWVRASGSDSVSKGSVIKLTSIAYNVGSHYDSSTGRFTAPVSGYYCFSAQVCSARTSSSGDYYFDFRLNGGYFNRVYNYKDSAGSYHVQASASVIRYINANDYVDLYYTDAPGTTTMLSDPNHTQWSGYLLG